MKLRVPEDAVVGPQVVDATEATGKADAPDERLDGRARAAQRAHEVAPERRVVELRLAEE